jgi:hypothetical protein
MKQMKHLYQFALLGVFCLAGSAFAGNDCCFTTDTDNDGDLDCIDAAAAACATASGIHFNGWTCDANGDMCSKKGGTMADPPLECYDTEGGPTCREVPTVSEYGLVILTILILTGGTLIVQRMRGARGTG